MLVVVCMLWGLSFPLMKNWQEASQDCPGGSALASFTLIGVRMLLALIVLAMVRPRLFVVPSRREQGIGALVGSFFFIGFGFQVVGLAWTTPAVSAFLTSLASAWVPLLGWLWLREAVPGLTAVGIGLALAGAAVLGLTRREQPAWGVGEILTLIGSVLFAVQVVVLNRFGPGVNSAHFTVSFMAITAALAVLIAIAWAASGAGVGTWLVWTSSMLGKPSVMFDLAQLTIFCTVLAFHWMNVYQPKVPAARVALIYLLEPVFGAAFSLLWGHDSLTGLLVFGGGLILGGNLLVEWPRWLARYRQARILSRGES
jgi:drug/metabolite transporter (DMT)-like permease